MNPASKSPLSVVLDPVAAAIIAQLKQQLEAKDQEIMRGQQALATTEMLVLKLKEELRLERIRKYGKRSEKLSDLQLQMLDLEPAVSSEEIESEINQRPAARQRAEQRGGQQATAQEEAASWPQRTACTSGTC